MRLAGRRAVVTGASSGIGRAIALAFAREGASVLVNYHRNDAGAQACVDEIVAAGGTATSFASDISEADAVRELIAVAADRLGAIDVWANIAGADILTGSAATLSDEAKLDRLITVDLRGTMLCCWNAAPVMTDGGVIINLSWDLALSGMGGRNPEMFAAVKAGVSGFTRSLARSLAPRLRVNEIAPGWIETAFAENDMAEDYRRGVIDQTPLARLGRPHDVAEAAVYLASDAAAFVTGQTIKVNGGLSS